MTNPRTLLGKTVTVNVDRPLGSIDPKHDNLIFPVNYGYAEGTVGPDGEALEAYVLGIEEEMAEFTGTVVAVIHRIDEEDDKLIVAPDDVTLTDDDILEATYFQEQYFESEIIR